MRDSVDQRGASPKSAVGTKKKQTKKKSAAAAAQSEKPQAKKSSGLPAGLENDLDRLSSEMTAKKRK